MIKLESKFKSKCPGCNEIIYPGDEIIQAGSGRWVHEHCPVVGDDDYQNDPLIRRKSEQIKRSLLHSKVDEDKPKKCIRCGNKSFLKKRFHTLTLDDGETFTTKLFICDKCFFVMQFIEE